MHESKFPQISSVGQRVTTKILDYVTQDNSDWENISRNVSLLGTLGHHITGVAYMDGLEQELFEKAQSEILNLAEYGSSYTSWSAAQDIVSYAKTFSNTEEVFPGVREAEEALDRFEARTQRGTPLVQARASEAYDRLSADKDVAQLMRLLYEDDELAEPSGPTPS